MEKLIGPDDTVVDVGANVGFFSLLAAQSVGSSGKVLAFEPVPLALERLHVNLQLNSAKNVAVYSIALSDATGYRDLYEGPPDHVGISSIRPIARAQRTIKVQTTTLDDMLTRLEIESIKLVKIDVEGAEQLVIQGMRRCLVRDRPFVVVEITDSFLRDCGHSASSLCHLLLDAGYQMFWISEKGLEQVDTLPHHWPSQMNALFAHHSRLAGADLI